jgi:hypothetical protein
MDSLTRSEQANALSVNLVEGTEKGQRPPTMPIFGDAPQKRAEGAMLNAYLAEHLGSALDE